MGHKIGELLRIIWWAIFLTTSRGRSGPVRGFGDADQRAKFRRTGPLDVQNQGMVLVAELAFDWFHITPLDLDFDPANAKIMAYVQHMRPLFVGQEAVNLNTHQIGA